MLLNIDKTSLLIYSTQKFGVNEGFFKENTFIQQEHIKLIKSDSNNINSVTKDLFFKEAVTAVLLNFLYSSNNPEENVSIQY